MPNRQASPNLGLARALHPGSPSSRTGALRTQLATSQSWLPLDHGWTGVISLAWKLDSSSTIKVLRSTNTRAGYAPVGS